MPSPLYASRQDVRDVFEGVIPDTSVANTRLDSLLRRASYRLTQIVPGLPTMLSRATIDADIPKDLVVEAVLRCWRNPAGVTAQNVGPFNQNFNSQSAQSDRIYFNVQEVQQLILSGAIGVTPSSFRVSFPGPQGNADGLDADGRYHYTPERH